MTRRTAATAILLVWAGALTWLGTRHLGARNETGLDDAIRSIPPGANFYSVSLDSVPIGFASNTVDTVPTGLVVDDRLVLEIPGPAGFQRAEARTVINLTNSLDLNGFETTMREATGRYGITGQVVGDTLQLRFETENTSHSVAVAAPGPVVLPSYLPLHLTFNDFLVVGSNSTVAVFDPLTLHLRQIDISVLAESTLLVPDSAAFDSVGMHWVPARWDTLRAWQVREVDDRGTAVSWIDELGRTVSTSSEVGWNLERSAFEIAFNNFQQRDRPRSLEGARRTTVVSQTALSSGAQPSSARAMRVRVTGLSLDATDIGGGRQSVNGDTLSVNREADAHLRSRYRLPGDTMDYGSYLSTEPLVPTSDARIQAQARLIVGRTRNPRRAAERLHDWIYERIAKEPAATLPSALEVLESRRGDSNGHTTLFVAMARAVGLPARTAAGLVHTGEQFYFHAWPEVYLGAWVAVDPTFGQFPAGAGHLRFAIGALARPIELLRLVGHTSIDIIAIEE